MMNGLKLVGLFLGYGLVGFTGEYALGLMGVDLGNDAVRFEHARVVRVEVEPSVRVDVDVEPRVEVAVEVRRSDCRYMVEPSLMAPASSGDRLRLDAGAGELKVEGRAGLDEVRVHATVCASDRELLDELTVRLDRSGSELRLETDYPDRSGFRRSRDFDASIDLVVEVPLGMAVDIDDTSGSMEVSGTGALRIDDSSGSIEVRGISGPVTIDDSSSGILVVDVAGDVVIDDSSGEIDVSDVHGTVRVSDSSGSIEISEVERDVVIEEDGSGSITVRDVQGDFSVLSDGNGGIRHSGVHGRVDIPVDEHGRRRGG